MILYETFVIHLKSTCICNPDDIQSAFFIRLCVKCIVCVRDVELNFENRCNGNEIFIIMIFFVELLGLFVGYL